MPPPYAPKRCPYPMFTAHDFTLYSQAMRAQPLERPTAEQMQGHAWLLTTPAVRASSPVARPARAEASDEEEGSAEEEEESEKEESEEEAGAGAEAQAGAEDEAGTEAGAGALCMAQLGAALPPV